MKSCKLNKKQAFEYMNTLMLYKVSFKQIKFYVTENYFSWGITSKFLKVVDNVIIICKVTHSIGIVIAFYLHCLHIFQTVLWTSHVADMKKFIFSSIARAFSDLLFCVSNYKSGLWLHLLTTMHATRQEIAIWIKSYEGHLWRYNLFPVLQPSCL